MGCMTPRSPRAWTPRPGSWASGDDGSPCSGLRVSRTGRARVARAVFPPQQVAEVKAIACELPVTHGLPLGRFSRTELHRLVIERGMTDASASTIWRWLHEDAIKRWQTRSWIFPRDPGFAEKAGRALDLYARIFDGRRLRPASRSSAPTRSPRYRPSDAGMRPSRLGAGARRWSSSSAAAAARWPTWPRGTSTTPTCLTASKPRPGSSRSAAW